MNTVEMVNTTANSAKQVSLTKLFHVFLKIGLLSFGGPAAQISLMHKVLVDENKWLSEQQYLNALGFCMLLPGPEAMQLATYAGWCLRGILGGLIAGLLFVIPGAIVILLLASLYTLYAGATFNDVAIVDTLFLGVKAAVLIIVVEALIKVSKRALKATAHWIIAALAFIGIFFLSIPFPLIILMAAFYGFFAIKPANRTSQEIPATA
ncbi:MAG: chromate transporter, partial [Oceanospirillaceae bacterium]